MQIYLLTTFSMKYKKLDLHFFWLFFSSFNPFFTIFCYRPLSSAEGLKFLEHMFQIDVITCHVVTKIGWMIHLVVLMHNDITELDVEIEP